MVKPVIQVCGDPVVDWLSPRRDGAQAVRLTAEPGGAALLTRLVSTLVPAATVDGTTIGPDSPLLREPGTDDVATTWSVWRQYASDGGRPYRLEAVHERESGAWKHEVSGLPKPDLLLIDDDNLGFRDDQAAWPKVLKSAGPRPRAIILLQRDCGGPLLDHLKATGLAARTTLVISVEALRACSVKVSPSLSWERLFDEVVAAVLSPACPFLAGSDLAFARVIVSIGTAGAVMVEGDRRVLVFDRAGQEGDFEHKRGGVMPGAGRCMAAALAAAWTGGAEATVDWASGVRTGVAMARRVFMLGYQAEGNALRFPYAGLAALEGGPAANLGLYERKAEQDGLSPWSILEATLAGDVTESAYQIAVRGPESVLKNVPVEQVGHWRSADRREIEGVRSVNNALRDYLARPDSSTPLCIGVFGPPGAGKSFAVKEIAKELGVPSDAILTFNLSQFESPAELPEAFHQVRDLNLKGKTPLVFWDEFDTPCQGRPLGWLRYFLAPMQDGEFADQGRVHPVGRGIYVFAGATRHSFQAFCAGDTREERDAKKPDFISRLRAYIDVRGPNADPHSLSDTAYVIRRAFLLNSCLRRQAPRVTEVDPGVLEAFLRVGRYRHGSRSLETIVRMSALAGKQKFELSSLPPDNVLGMHVPAAEFTALTRRAYARPLRVGITGHINLDPARMEELENGVARAVGYLSQLYPDRALTVFSPMAVGADRLVARELLKQPGARLIAVLPVPAEDYINDFGTTDDHAADYSGAELRQEFRHWLTNRACEVIEMGPTPTRDEAYRQAGYEVAGHCHVLMAVWDGQGAQGVGGTAEIVARAAQRGVPVIHVWAGNHKKDPTRRTTVGEKHGQFRTLNFPGQEPGVWSSER